MVTQQQIADQLGVSRQLVTLALAGNPKISVASRQRILDTVRRMGYSPNPHARALNGRTTGIVALWIPDLISNHYIHVARELGRLARQSHRELIIGEVGTADAQQHFSLVPADGVIAVDTPEQVNIYRRLPSANSIPLIGMGAHCPKKGDFVQVDLKTGTVRLMEHLINTGYRRIAHATFFQKDPRHDARRAEYDRSMRNAGLKPEFIYYPLSEQQRPSSRKLIQEYIREHGAPDAIFCHSDDAAVGIYRGLCDMGLRVPDQVALAGCDGIDDIEYLECPLTTLVQPVATMCATVWQFFLNRLEQPNRKLQRTVILPELAIRQSTSPRTTAVAAVA